MFSTIVEKTFSVHTERIMIGVVLIYGILTCAIFFTVKWCYKVGREWKYMLKFRTPDDYILLFGNKNAYLDNDKMFNWNRSAATAFYPHYRASILHFVAVNILTPEDCEIFMSTSKHTTKSVFYDKMKVWLNEGLLISNGEKWFQRRRLLTNAFHFNILKDFLNVFNEETQRTVEILNEKCNEPLEITSIVAEFTLLSLCETAMGNKMDPQDKSFQQYIKAVKEMVEFLAYKVTKPWLDMPLIYYFTPYYKKEKKCLKILHDFTRNVIKQRMETYEKTKDSRLEDVQNDDLTSIKKKKRKAAMLDILLQAHMEDNSIDLEGICEEVDTFMFEGHDTTATAICFCLMLIANHPDVQDKIVQEIHDVMKGKTTGPTFEDLQKMEYLERCIKESLRLYPSVFFIGRVADEDLVLKSGLMVPKGVMVHIHIFDVLRDPNTFPNPNKFDPDRFLKNESVGRHPFSYIPFSAGTRNCIGQKYAILEMKSFLIGVLSRFVLSPVDTPESITLTMGLVLKSKNGIRVKFTPRH